MSILEIVHFIIHIGFASLFGVAGSILSDVAGVGDIGDTMVWLSANEPMYPSFVGIFTK